MLRRSTATILAAMTIAAPALAKPAMCDAEPANQAVRLTCDTPELRALEEKDEALRKQIMSALGKPDGADSSSYYWRDQNCKDVECLRKWYDTQMWEHHNTLDHIKTGDIKRQAPQPAGPHYYTWTDGDLYAYRLVQSEFAREHGAQAPSITYAFAGLGKDGVYRLTQMNGQYLDRVTCRAPCDTVTITGFDRTTISLRQGTALWAAVQDMLAGQLKVSRDWQFSGF